MNFFFNYLSNMNEVSDEGEQENTNGDTNGSTTEQPEREIGSPATFFGDDEILRWGVSVPITTILLSYPNQIVENNYVANLNGSDSNVTEFNDQTSYLFSLNILPGNSELLKRLQQTILMYRKEKLNDLTKNETVECCICFVEKEHSITLRCNHKFCSDCINNLVFVSNRNICPLCRDIFIN